MRTRDGLKLYRGLRKNSKTTGYSFWTPYREYAQGYGDLVIQGELQDDSRLFDLRELVDNNGWISAATLDEQIDGLARVFGLEEDEEVKLSLLWERNITGDMSKVAALLKKHGYEGFIWVEQDNQDAFFLIH